MNSTSPNGLYMMIVGASVIGYGLTDQNKNSGDLVNQVLLVAALGGLVGMFTGGAWRGAAIGSGLGVGYEIYKSLSVPKSA